MKVTLSTKIFSRVLLLAVSALLLSPTQAHAALVDRGDGTVSADDVGLSWSEDAGLLRTMSWDHPELINEIIAAVPGGVIHDSENYWDNGIHKIEAADFQYAFDSFNVWYEAADWWGAQAFVIYLNGINYLGHNNWRLPAVNPVNGTSLIYGSAFDGSADVGYNIANPASELAYLFHVELGNKGFYRTNGVPWAAGTGVTQNGPFQHIQNSAYWASDEFAPNHDKAWSFATVSGKQDGDSKNHMLWVWPVRSGSAQGQ